MTGCGSFLSRCARAEPVEARALSSPSHLMRRRITGFSNPTVKWVRGLRDKKQRRREARFLAEGLRLLTDARAAGRLPELLLMAQGRDEHPLLAVLEAEVLAAGGETIELPAELLAKVTGKDNPQAVAGGFAQL